MTDKKIHLTSKVYHFSRCGLPIVASANVDSNRLAFRVVSTARSMESTIF